MTTSHEFPIMKVSEDLIHKIIQRSTALVGNITDTLKTISLLYSRYFFRYSIIFYDSNKQHYVKVPSISSIFQLSNDNNYVLCIDIHKQVIVMEYYDYISLHQRNVNFTHNDIDKIIQTIDSRIEHIPINYRLTYSYNDRIMKIYHDRLMFVYESREYLISRDIIDMMYAETQDFIFTEQHDTNINVVTETRHKLYHKKDFLCDLLKEDLASIMDIQDKLKKEQENIAIPYSKILHNKKTNNTNIEFKYNPEEFG